jgi:hypothetical protein
MQNVIIVVMVTEVLLNEYKLPIFPLPNYLKQYNITFHLGILLGPRYGVTEKLLVHWSVVWWSVVFGSAWSLLQGIKEVYKNSRIKKGLESSETRNKSSVIY